MIQLQPLVAMGRGLARKCSRTNHSLSRGLVVTENSHQFVCHLYGTPEQTIDNVRLQHFSKAKLGLEMLPPTRDDLELHTACTNCQAKIWLQADQEHIVISSPTGTSAWTMEYDCLKAVWTRLHPIPDACLELVTYGCKSKCRTARCTCFKKNLNCTYACGCDGMDCCNPAGQ